MKIPFVGVYCPPASRSLKLYHPLSRNRFVPTSENPSCTASHDTASQDKQPWSSRCHLKADHKPKEVQQQLKGNLHKQGKKYQPAQISAESVVRLPFLGNPCTATHSTSCRSHAPTEQRLLGGRRSLSCCRQLSASAASPPGRQHEAVPRRGVRTSAVSP